jgi:hypothetical protein
MESLTDAERRAVLSEFLDRVEVGRGLLPAAKPFLYDPVAGIASASWRLGLVSLMVEGELQEMTNQLNRWLGSLRRWHAWNEVLVRQEEDFRWSVEWEWVEPLAFYCMFQPSANRDRFIMVATNALHQVRMAIDPAIKDELLGDPTEPGKKRSFPSRRESDAQLKEMANDSVAGKTFVQTLGQLDNEAYRRITADFRNRTSHGIAPRFSIGDVVLVTRAREQAIALEEQPDMSFEFVPVPDKMATSYSFGGTPPLLMQQAWEANRAQFECARCTFNAYIALLTEAIASMPKRAV